LWDWVRAERWDAKIAKDRKEEPALARTCKIIRIDDLNAFYRCNTFLAGEDLDELREWPEKMGPECRKQLRSLYVVNQIEEWTCKSHDEYLELCEVLQDYVLEGMAELGGAVFTTVTGKDLRHCVTFSSEGAGDEG